MVLIIAEKPSLARNIAAGIGQMQKKNGYFEGAGRYGCEVRRNDVGKWLRRFAVVQPA